MDSNPPLLVYFLVYSTRTYYENQTANDKKKIDDVFYDLPLLKNVHCTVTQSNVKVCICM